MKLKSFGCSFVYGSELADCGFKSTTPSRLTYPALLAQDLGYEYNCHARGGSGNLQILNSILEHVNQEPALFVVNWTWIDRFDYVDNQELWQTLLPGHDDRLSDFYYRNLHSQYIDKLRTLTCMFTAINALKQRHQFIMTAMDDLIAETRFHFNPAIEYLQHEVLPYIKSFDGCNLLDFARKNNYEVSDLWHPLEAAHQAAYRIVRTWI